MPGRVMSDTSVYPPMFRPFTVDGQALTVSHVFGVARSWVATHYRSNPLAAHYHSP
jgi:hypothetical protein